MFKTFSQMMKIYDPCVARENDIGLTFVTDEVILYTFLIINKSWINLVRINNFYKYSLIKKKFRQIPNLHLERTRMEAVVKIIINKTQIAFHELLIIEEFVKVT